MEPKEDRDEMLALLSQKDRHVHYFYCHGEVEDNEFRLMLGTKEEPGYIASQNLNPRRIRWRGPPQPLIILNCCESVATLPELIHGFLGKLRTLGASGVVGTEIKVRTELARPFGRLVLKGMLEGQSVGEAFLAARLYLLRQFNPLGLVYTLHAPATLHLHPVDECGWCERHPGGRG